MDALRELYHGSYGRLVGQLYGVTGSLPEAQDVVQEAFVVALCRPRRFARLTNPEAWLRTVAVNVARRRARRIRRFGELADAGMLDPPAAPAELSPDHVMLMAALRRLPAAQREVIGLHHLADLPLDEVAETLGTSVGTVKSRLSRGRARLAELLAEPSREGT